MPSMESPRHALISNSSAKNQPFAGNHQALKCTSDVWFRPAEGGIGMSIDDLLFIIIIGGTVLSGAYLRAEYVSWRRYKAAERRRQASLARLYET
jgi:hypothetical protein